MTAKVLFLQHSTPYCLTSIAVCELSVRPMWLDIFNVRIYWVFCSNGLQCCCADAIELSAFAVSCSASSVCRACIPSSQTGRTTRAAYMARSLPTRLYQLPKPLPWKASSVPVLTPVFGSSCLAIFCERVSTDGLTMTLSESSTSCAAHR